MVILSHREYWKSEGEKNKKIAFIRSFQMGFGIETDIRDFNGELVISHDLPDESSMKFDVLMSVYSGENAANFLLAIESILFQTILPSQIVLVVDGTITGELLSSVEYVKEQYSLINLIQLHENVGLGLALSIGLKHCREEYVVRCDSDDINDPNRFQLLLNGISTAPRSVAVVGSFVTEFTGSPDNITSLRNFPLVVSSMMRFCRDPLAHPSVVFKKSAIETVGGYKHLPYFEDTYLWVRLLKSGFHFINVPIYLVHMRTSNAFFNRRGGFRYMVCEYDALNRFRRENLIGFGEFLFCCCARLPVRMLPSFFLSLLYRFILRSRIKA